MKIVSRPEDTPVGEGPYTIKMTSEQLQYIASLVYCTRLGPGPYEEAAFGLSEMIDDLFGDDFMEDASNDVNMRVTIEDNRGNAVAEYSHGDVCIEVGP